VAAHGQCPDPPETTVALPADDDTELVDPELLIELGVVVVVVSSASPEPDPPAAADVVGVVAAVPALLLRDTAVVAAEAVAAAGISCAMKMPNTTASPMATAPMVRPNPLALVRPVRRRRWLAVPAEPEAPE
jgi:hypothetical protein